MESLQFPSYICDYMQYVFLIVNCPIFVSDYDECCAESPCPDTSTCTNIPTSFECTCGEGYFRNGSVCQGKHFKCIWHEILHFRII